MGPFGKGARWAGMDTEVKPSFAGPGRDGHGLKPSLAGQGETQL